MAGPREGVHLTRRLLSWLCAAVLTIAIAAPAMADVALEPVGTFSQPVQALSPPGDSRVFVVEKGGLIRIAGGGTFLDIRSLVSSGGERGLLGMAFHPGYPGNPRFYVNYTDTSGNTRVVEYQVSTDPNVANAGSARQIIRIVQPYSNHSG